MLYTPTEKNNNIKNDYLPEVERFRTFEEMSLLTHFNEERPLDKIRQYIQGAPWEVEFYTQYLNINDVANNPDINLSIDVQQYIKISKLIIYLQKTLDQADIENLEVEAIINAGFLVKQGDCFVATIIGGRRGLFVAEEVTTEHYNLHQVFKVKFTLNSFLEKDVTLYNNITSKVVRTYVYNKDFVLDGTSPLLTKSEYSLKDDIQDAIDDSVEYYFKTFLDPDSKFLKLPNKNEQLHYIDQELNKFCRAVISVMEYPELTRVQTIDYQMDKSVRYTIWDAILNRNPVLIRKCEPFIGFKPSPYSRSNLNSLHVEFMGVDYIVDKVDKPTKIDGVLSTDVPIDKAINITPRQKATIVEDRRDTIKSAVLWNMAIPGLDFNTNFSSLYHEPKPNIPNNPLTPPADENNGIPDTGVIPPIFPGNSTTPDTGNTDTGDNTNTNTGDTGTTGDTNTGTETGDTNNTGITTPNTTVPNIDTNNLNPLVPGKDKVSKPQPSPLPPGKIPPIKTTKQYSLFPKKGVNNGG